MKLRLGMATILAVALVVGFRVHSAHKQSGGEATATKQVSSRPDTFQAPGSTQNPAAASNQSTASNLMARYHLDARLANFIAQAKMQVTSNDNTSIHYLLTFPDGVTSDETITITPGQRYQPTPVELQKSKGPGIQIFKPTLSAKKTGPKDTSFTLHYYVVQSSLPTDFQQWLQTSSPPLRSFEHFFELVPAAWAQQGGGDNGAESLTFNLIELAKNFEVHGLENAEMEKSAHALDNILTVKDLIKGYLEASDWLGEIGELQNCARNPTNPLAIEASQDPNYQKEVLDPLNDASSEIQMTAFPKVANIAASALTQFHSCFRSWSLPCTYRRCQRRGHCRNR